MKLLSYLSEWVYPYRCVICGDVLKLGSEENGLCEACSANIPFIAPPVCRFCGAHTDFGTACSRCAGRSHEYEEGYSPFTYETMRWAIKRLKFDGFKSYAKPLAGLMHKFVTERYPKIYEKTDVIAAMPIHAKRMKSRGFNQCSLLAENLALLCGKEVLDNVIIREKETLPQNKLSIEERQKNVKNAFKVVDGKRIKGKNILLIDDIFTTGSTLNECAKTLLRAGAGSVAALTLSVTEFKDRHK